MKEKEDIGIDLENFSIEDEIERFKGLVEVRGWSILVRLFVRPQKVGGLIMPDSIKQRDEDSNYRGLVVGVGKAVYQDPRYAQTGPWCRLGEWVVFPRYAGYKIKILGMPMFVLKEDMIDLEYKDNSIFE